MFQGFQFPKTMLVWFEAHPGMAGWMQAIIAGLAIIAVYFAASMPIRAEAKRRRARADPDALGNATAADTIEPGVHTPTGKTRIGENGSWHGTPECGGREKIGLVPSLRLGNCFEGE